MRLLSLCLLGLLEAAAFGFQSQSSPNPATPPQPQPKPGAPAGTPGAHPKPGAPAFTPDGRAGHIEPVRPYSPSRKADSAPASPADVYSRLGKGIDERFEAWNTAHSAFEAEFARRMADLRASPTDFEERRFCSAWFSPTLAQLKVLLEEWLVSRRLYWSRYGQDAQQALEAANDVVANQPAASSRLNRDVEEARADLDSLLRQREDLRTSLAASSEGAAQRARTKAAIAELDAMIVLAEFRIEAATKANGGFEGTRESLLQTEQYRALIGRIDEALRLVEFDRRYWSSFYSRRAAQISEVCAPPAATPRVVK